MSCKKNQKELLTWTIRSCYKTARTALPPKSAELRGSNKVKKRDELETT